MTGPAAKLLAHSVSAYGKELKTFEITMHRFVLPEFNTHREFSRNFRSSRAVPTKKLIEEVRTSPAMPVYWGKNQAGMQAAEELTGGELDMAQYCWRKAAHGAAADAQQMLNLGVHKQIVNRILEPFLYVHGVVTSSNYANFYALRRHKDAQPEIKALADAMWEAEQGSNPELLQLGDWHLPYIEPSDYTSVIDHARSAGKVISTSDMMDVFKKISAARCARVSYKPFDADRRSTVEEDLALFDKLVGGQPMHASPTEHQATPDEYSAQYEDWDEPYLHGNLKGWCQHRKYLTGEYVKSYP